ncbi:carbon-nitrogen hydrolase family protein [Aureitalea marina]|uniref:Nitrilase n=1 Tax=Aureitalea marina TaxID=930804 RepID=A0A2S7KPQ7_9FLAO|nr:carbon-nitrogen hydrolase family protein [Aureitalea marina]PQB04614.1 nitrilase [Aureitalea marina]
MKVWVGLVQQASAFFDKEKGLEQLAHWTAECAKNKCDLVVFPESFIPGYPRGFDFGAVVGSRNDEGRELYNQYHKQSMDLSGEDGALLEDLAKEHQQYLVVGITEKEQDHGSLYCSMVYVSPEKGIMGVHRKIKPTGTERVIWAEAGAESLVSFQTEIGRLGGLICWENYMPLARMSMYERGVQIYLAPTADARDSWVRSLQHIALEGRCFVMGCNQYFTPDMYPEELSSQLRNEERAKCRGGSVIVSPFGEIIAGPLWDESGLVVAEIDLEDINRSKLDFDPKAHYNRPDIFKFDVPDQPPTYEE